MDGLPLYTLIRYLRRNAEDQLIRGSECLEHSGDHPSMVARGIEMAHHVYGSVMDHVVRWVGLARPPLMDGEA